MFSNKQWIFTRGLVKAGSGCTGGTDELVVDAVVSL